MICEGCGEDFVVSMSEEKYMRLGKIPQLCIECAKKQYHEEHAFEPEPPPRYPLRAYDGKGTRLFSALYVTGAGNHVRIRIPDKELHPKKIQVSLGKPRIADRTQELRQVSVIRTDSARSKNAPSTRIWTNIASFRERGEDFRVLKSPRVVDTRSGVWQIRVPLLQVYGVNEEPYTYRNSLSQEVHAKTQHVLLRNGGFVRLSYL